MTQRISVIIVSFSLLLFIGLQHASAQGLGKTFSVRIDLSAGIRDNTLGNSGNLVFIAFGGHFSLLSLGDWVDVGTGLALAGYQEDIEFSDYDKKVALLFTVPVNFRVNEKIHLNLSYARSLAVARSSRKFNAVLLGISIRCF